MLISAHGRCGLPTDRLEGKSVCLGPFQLLVIGHLWRFVDYLLQSDLITIFASFDTVVSFV